MSLQTIHVLLGEEPNKPSFHSDPNVSLHVILCMLGYIFDDDKYI